MCVWTPTIPSSLLSTNPFLFHRGFNNSPLAKFLTEGRNVMGKGSRKPNLIPFRGKSPFVEEGVFVDPTSRIMGDVTLRSGASVWPLAVLRADSEAIVIEANSVILDKVLVEAPMGHRVLIEGDAIISHGAILHGCTIRRGALIGIGAIILDGAEVGRDSIIASGSVVPPGARIPEGSLALGIPAKVVRPLNESEMAAKKEQLSEVMKKSEQYQKIFG
jgi:carbonic anhydrase/acetyltransferase-like protein (isoleucine patch superfamily)